MGAARHHHGGLLSTPLDDVGLLRAYDDQLRGPAETPSAVATTELGPLRLVTFAGGRGFVTYRDLGGADADGVTALVAGAVDHFRANPDLTRVDWKTRGHDDAPGLEAALGSHGFVPQEPETVMVGALAGLAVEVPLPDGVTLRRVSDEPDVRAMSAAGDVAFGEPVSTEMAEALLRRLALDDGMELWVAEADGRMVSSGRLEPVAGTEFAGLWGGATHPAWRSRGLYRALTAARARSALDLGLRLAHSDSTPDSRPVLERSGLRAVGSVRKHVLRLG